MTRMFWDCKSLLKEVPSFETQKVEVMGRMFQGCSSLKYVPQFDISNVENNNNMFKGCDSLSDFDAIKNLNVKKYKKHSYHDKNRFTYILSSYNIHIYFIYKKYICFIYHMKKNLTKSLIQ